MYSHPARVRALVKHSVRDVLRQPLHIFLGPQVPYFDFANHSAKPNARWTMGADRELRPHPLKSTCSEVHVAVFIAQNICTHIFAENFVLPGRLYATTQIEIGSEVPNLPDACVCCVTLGGHSCGGDNFL